MNDLYAVHRKWPDHVVPLGNQGIVVGADLTQQNLLPWWWEHYRSFNSFPVAFVDFGMSQEMKKWCKERGECIDLPVADVFVTDRGEIDPEQVKSMEEACGKAFWTCRNAWFKKPLACLKSPFQHSLWMDLDCQILGSLDPIFSYCGSKLAMAIEPYHGFCRKRGGRKNPIYNAGLIGFDHGDPMIQLWADQAFKRNHLFRGDQELLNAMIKEQNYTPKQIPSIYNWSRLSKPNPKAIIIHWHGPHGKTEIYHQITKSRLNSLSLLT